MIRKFISIISVFLLFLFLSTKVAFALNPVSVKLDITPVPCPNEAGGNCHKDLNDVYTQRGESCTTTYDDFLKDPAKNHFWIEDPDITAQGKADERARQFIYWTLNKNAIDDHPVLKNIWSNARNIALFFIIVVAAVLGVGLMIGQRMQYDLRLQIWPIVFKILLSLLYIVFSATIVILLIQISELFMRFFNETLGGRDLFNIYFSGTSQEKNYTNWVGCRDINYRVQEGAEAEIMMLKLTNITYYVMGGMLLLRKVLLWFMLFVSPFLAILMPFVFIRNTGWIWIGVFFQWLFYGPLFALFLGATHQIWLAGIPYPFDFSRVNQIGAGADSPGGYVYPTAINILYGGPAQGLQIRNNGNYADTFAEYVLSLIMLWAVTFFPWWLLRIFRDYCCDGIMAMKNILLAMFDQGRGGPGPQGPGPTPNPLSFFTGSALKVPQRTDTPTDMRREMKFERIEEIKQAKTEEITRSMQISAKNITDIARIETNKETRETVNRNINLLQNPMQATTSKERQQFMNIKSELFNRAVKEDHVAKQVLTTLSTSKIEQIQKKQEFVQNIPQAKQASVTNIVSVKVKMPQDKVASITNNFINSVSKNTQAMTTISSGSGVPQAKVQNVLTGFAQYPNEAPAEVVNKLEKQTGVEKQRVVAILKQTHAYVAKNKEIAKEVAEKQKIKPEEAQKVFDAQIPAVTEPEKQVEQTITIPPTVSIEDYEEVKKMWKEQYVAGEVPVTDTVKTRDEWIEQDVVFVTNTLNKLVSNDEKLKTEGLEDLGYILPVFMVNNFTPAEVLVYLKAKLEAAKEVNENIATQKLQVKTTEEEFVDVAPVKRQEAAREMRLEEAQAMPIEPSTAETVSSVGEPQVQQVPAGQTHTTEEKGKEMSQPGIEIGIATQKPSVAETILSSQQEIQPVQAVIKDKQQLKIPSQGPEIHSERRVEEVKATPLTQKPSVAETMAAKKTTPKKQLAAREKEISDLLKAKAEEVGVDIPREKPPVYEEPKLKEMEISNSKKEDKDK